MKKIEKDKMKLIIGGVVFTSCGLKCADGNFHDYDCGNGVNCNTNSGGWIECGNSTNVTKHYPCQSVNPQ